MYISITPTFGNCKRLTVKFTHNLLPVSGSQDVKNSTNGAIFAFPHRGTKFTVYFPRLFVSLNLFAQNIPSLGIKKPRLSPARLSYRLINYFLNILLTCSSTGLRTAGIKEITASTAKNISARNQPTVIVIYALLIMPIRSKSNAKALQPKYP